MSRTVQSLLAFGLWLVCLGGAPAAAAEREPERPGPEQVQRTIPDSVRFDQEIANGNLVHMTVTNYGFYGNNFFNRTASLEYPAGRGYEHIVRGGLWVGGTARDEVGEFSGVTSGTVDAAQGPSSPEASEWTPGDRGILFRSVLPTSPYFDRFAVSELDLVCRYNDFTLTRAASNSENHRPMRLEVRQETYQWNFAEFAHILFVHLEITNRGSLIENLWTGIYSELASGNKGAYVNWPPSSSDPGGQGSWFNNKWIVYDPVYAMLREHYCDNVPLPPDPSNGCLLERAPYWIGVKYLGSRGLLEDTTDPRQISLSAWSWSPGNTFRDEDRERFALMNTGMIQPLDGDSLLPRTGDPAQILAVGPFPLLYRDSTISVDFAILGGAQVADIQHHATFAQFAYDHDYILPVPPPAPRVAVVPREGALDIYWNNVSESAYDVTSPHPNDFEGYRVYVGEDADTLARVAQFDSQQAPGDTAGFNTGFSAVQLATPAVIRDSLYQYRFSVPSLRTGSRYYVAVTAFDLGNSQVAPLESGLLDGVNRIPAVPAPAPGERPDLEPTVFPNPYRVEAHWDQGRLVRDHYLWFTNLPQRCRLRIYTLSGDLVFEQDFDGSTYHGEGARGIFDPANPRRVPTLSGTTFGWNLISREGQAVATGLYMFAVEDRASGERHVGKFLIVKSDRESR